MEIQEPHDVNPLPEIDDFTDDERLLARFVVGAIHSGGTMFEGRLFECVLSRLLGADLPPRGVWPWDLRLRDHDDVSQRTRIEVRSGAKTVSMLGHKNAAITMKVCAHDLSDGTRAASAIADAVGSWTVAGGE